MERLAKPEIPCIGDSQDAYGRVLDYVYLNIDGAGSYEHLYNEDLVELARATSFSHEHRREFESLGEEAEERGAGFGAPAQRWMAIDRPVAAHLQDARAW